VPLGMTAGTGLGLAWRMSKIMTWCAGVASAGSCLAGGTAGAGYVSDFHGFVAEELNGQWARAAAVPGLAALNKGGSADVSSVSCTSPGDCAAGGYYTDKDGSSQGSWPPSGTAPGARRSQYPAWLP
jgi:hypothetical protein